MPAIDFSLSPLWWENISSSAPVQFFSTLHVTCRWSWTAPKGGRISDLSDCVRMARVFPWSIIVTKDLVLHSPRSIWNFMVWSIHPGRNHMRNKAVTEGHFSPFLRLGDQDTPRYLVTFEETLCIITWVFRFQGFASAAWFHWLKKLISVVDFGQCARVVGYCSRMAAALAHDGVFLDTERDQRKCQVNQIWSCFKSTRQTWMDAWNMLILFYTIRPNIHKLEMGASQRPSSLTVTPSGSLRNSDVLSRQLDENFRKLFGHPASSKLWDVL